MTDAATGSAPATEMDGSRSVTFSVLVGVAAVVVVLQGVWAGIFLEHDGRRDAASTAINLHAAGGYLATGLAIVALVVALVRLEERQDLIVGSAVFALLLIVETGLGVAIHSGSDALTAIDVPLAMAIVAVAVWLPLRARSRS
jgi:hypothetical protein